MIRLWLLKIGAGRTAALSCALGLLAVPALAAGPEMVTFKASYAISIAGIGIGRADVESRFIGNSYAAAITGSTNGVSRLVSDASARLAGNGRFFGNRVVPSAYNLETNENGFQTHVKMAMASGRITDVEALPRLLQTKDRVPVTPRHKIDVVDPLSAFLVPLDRPGVPSGRRACDRTVRVFDGWTRYDIQLYYKDTRAVDGGTDAYVGRVIVCGARYVPIAGHRTGNSDAMSSTRLEVWLAQLPDMPVLVPYRMQIGTDLGDLVIYSTRFTVDKAERRADAKVVSPAASP
ncbi:MAG TPA: DUF3108 domain-containing protein [Bauldia sp.]|nr:DUF3108 domain-containing protein [Bauldia sp.]